MRNFRIRSRMREDDGMAMILVIGFTFVIMLLLSVVITQAIQANTDGRSHQKFDLALGGAEAGVDQMLGRITADHTFSVGPDVPAGGFPACSAGSTATPEQCWARQQLLALATSDPSLITSDGTSEYIAMRPSNRQTVYAMGWAPSFAEAAKTRVVKSEYIFAPYRPTKAILTQGSVDLSGSVLVDSAAGSPAAVHSNGDIESLPSDHIEGPVTASGNYDGRATVTNDPDNESGSAKPLETVPAADPRTAYVTLAADENYTSNWYDLCPDGSVHGPSTSTFVPCTGPVLNASGPYRGWEFTAASGSDPALWSMSEKDSPYFGVYYVYQANAEIGHNGGNSHQPWNATVITESAPSGGGPASCGKLGGDIDWKLYDIQGYVSGLVLLADADLYDSANNNAGDGLFVAGDQVHFHTSSATLTGAIVAGDACTGSPADSNEIQGVEVHFDDTGEAPIASIVSTTLWLEYVG